MNKIIYLIIAFLGLLTFSCNKEEQTILPEDNSMVKFTSQEEYQSTLQKVLGMNLEELKKYEKEKGYKSLGRTNEEFYENIDFDKFNSKEEILSFVEKNNNQLQLIEDENGELELEPKLSNNSNRYFLNNDKMFQIGDTVLKEFESGTIITNFENIEDLKNSRNQINSLIQDNRFTFIPNNLHTSKNLKSTNDDCGNSYTWRSTSGKNRLKIEISVENYTSGNNAVKCEYLQRPYKKTLGIWYWCTRTMSADIKITFNVHAATNWSGSSCWDFEDLEEELIFYKNNTSASKFEKTEIIWCACQDPAFFSGFRIDADTPSVDRIFVICG